MLNGIFFLFSNAWNGFKTLYVPPTVSKITAGPSEIELIKKELQQLRAENTRLKNVETDYRKSIREQAEEITNLKALIASYERRLEESESLVASNKRRLEETELLVISYQRCLEKNQSFFDTIEKGLVNLKEVQGLDYSRTMDYIVLSTVRDVKILTFKLTDIVLESGDKIYVCGGHKLLGEWVPTSGLELTPVNSHYEVSVGVNELAQRELGSIQYKYALLRGNAWYWESGKDRFRENPIYSDIVDIQPREWEVNPCLSSAE
ncbi:hypothetical protein K7432_002467 [Basidiobolus ranarum]|uniref:CBM20 domain-containing protein n=1 Tax=Basidiobolus ranarum TaxID=34480 RepID=A0ABR2W7Q1_9FUNG